MLLLSYTRVPYARHLPRQEHRVLEIVASQYSKLINKVILSCTHKGYALPIGSPLREPYKLRLEERKKCLMKSLGN